MVREALRRNTRYRHQGNEHGGQSFIEGNDGDGREVVVVSIELGLGIYLVVRDGEGAGIVPEENARVGIIRRGETPRRIVDDEAF